MGYSATAIAFMGLRVDPTKLEEALYTTTQVRGCVHDDFTRTTNMQFCPICGEPIYKVEKSPVPGYDEDEEILHGFKLMERVNGCGYEFIVLASAAANSNEVARMPDVLVDLNFAREQMRKALEPMGLFDGETFGLHVFLSESV